MRVKYNPIDSLSSNVRPIDLTCYPDSTNGRNFGFGYWWKNELIASYAGDVDTFMIVDGSKEYVITDSTALSDYMRSARSWGLFNATWRVKAPLSKRKQQYFQKQESSQF